MAMTAHTAPLSHHALAEPRPVDDGPRWRRRVACAHYDPEWWWPLSTHDPDRDFEATKRAIAICWSECSVRQQCLELAVRNREDEGIWGGLRPIERAQWAEAHGLTGRRPPIPRVVPSLPDETLLRLRRAGWSVRQLAAVYRVTERSLNRRFEALAGVS